MDHKKKGLLQWQNGFRPPDAVGAAIFIVAKFGRYQARKSDPPLGDQIIWRGYSTLLNDILLKVIEIEFDRLVERLADINWRGASGR